VKNKVPEHVFINEIEPKNIHVKIIKYLKRYFGEGSFLIEIDIKPSDYVCFKSGLPGAPHFHMPIDPTRCPGEFDPL